MKNLCIFSFTLLFFVSSFSQDSLLVNQKYFEDQLYVGITYNILMNKPQDLQQKGISTGVNVGFLKDFPLNKKGSVAVAIGLGYGYNKYIQNMKIQNQLPEFSIIEDAYSKNKFETHAFEIPVELRFRKSLPSVYKFWRLYVGGKVSYVLYSRSYFENTLEYANERIVINNLPNLKKLQYGPQVSFGYSTWNFYTYFNMGSLFDKNPATENIDIDELNSLKVGLQFYIF